MRVKCNVGDLQAIYRVSELGRAARLDWSFHVAFRLVPATLTSPDPAHQP